MADLTVLRKLEADCQRRNAKRREAGINGILVVSDFDQIPYDPKFLNLWARAQQIGCAMGGGAAFNNMFEKPQALDICRSTIVRESDFDALKCVRKQLGVWKEW